MKLYLQSNFGNVRSYVRGRKRQEVKVNYRFQEIASILNVGFTICFGIGSLHLKEFVDNMVVIGLTDNDPLVDSRVIAKSDHTAIEVLREFKCMNAVSLTGWQFKYKNLDEIVELVRNMGTFVRPGGQVVFEVDPKFIQYNRLQVSNNEIIHAVINHVNEALGYETSLVFPSSYDRTKPLIYRAILPK